MLEIILSIFLTVLSIIGLIELFKLTVVNSLNSQKNKNNILIIPISGHREEAEILLRDAIFQTKWLSKNDHKKVICLDLGMDDETKKICNIIKIENDFIYFCTPDNLIEVLKNS